MLFLIKIMSLVTVGHNEETVVLLFLCVSVGMSAFSVCAALWD